MERVDSDAQSSQPLLLREARFSSSVFIVGLLLVRKLAIIKGKHFLLVVAIRLEFHTH